MPESTSLPLLAFGAHPDDLEFAVGAVIAREVNGGGGRAVHLVVCSRGEAATHGTPQEREQEARAAAGTLGATIEFVELDGDAHLEVRTKHALAMAMIIRRVRPGIVLAPTTVESQHPDHAALGRIVRSAARLARYGGVKELQGTPPHAIDMLLGYAVTPEAEPRDGQPIFVDVSAPEIMRTWQAAMEAHRSQLKTRNYVELALTRARLNGLRAGIGHAIALFPDEPLVVDSLFALGRSARQF